ncbi:MAG: hypothetical protein K2V38_14195, partial [Gemmataceae bacterium]|nr:hypothetical protein [Gemmataceae bacterium]
MNGSRDTGDVEALADALARQPQAGLVVYHRCSTHSQAGTGLTRLHAKTAAVVEQVQGSAPGRVVEVVQGVEEGRLSARRRHLDRAVERVLRERQPTLLVAIDLSRFLRSEDYHRQANPEAWPTAEEFER